MTERLVMTLHNRQQAWAIIKAQLFPALASVLHGVRAFDPFVLGACTSLFFLAAAIACWIPARRATKVNPLEALRAE